MIDIDDPLNEFANVFGKFAVITILVFQYEICVAMPEQWFTGFVSAIVLVICVKITFHHRE